jgi:hypothetical protein
MTIKAMHDVMRRTVQWKCDICAAGVGGGKRRRCCARCRRQAAARSAQCGFFFLLLVSVLSWVHDHTMVRTWLVARLTTSSCMQLEWPEEDQEAAALWRALQAAGCGEEVLRAEFHVREKTVQAALLDW